MKKSSLQGKKRVTFKLAAEKGSDVSVAGSFNDWNPAKHKMKFKDGAYSVTCLIPKGVHEYKYVVNGLWCVDPECDDWSPNGMGSLNSVISVG